MVLRYVFLSWHVFYMRGAKHHLTWPYFGTLSNQQQKLTNMSSTYLQWCIFFSKYFSTVNFWVKSGAWSANLKEIHSLLSTNVALDGIAPLHVETGNDQGGLATGSTKYERIPRSRLYYGLWRLWTLNPVFVGNIWIDIIFLHDIILNSTSHTCN